MCSLFLHLGIVLEIIMSGASVMAAPSSNFDGWDTENTLVFPDSGENDLSAPTCHNATFCETLDEYPADTFHEILGSKPYSTRYYQYFQNLRENEPILQSRSEGKHEYFICPSTKSVVYPKAAYNLKNEVKFIYNLPSYRQGVSIEVCVKTSECKFYDKVKFFRTKCKQKFVERLLLTADDSGRPYVDRYKFPSTCVCSYTPERSFSHFSRLYN